ncbi:hypothetical protein [Mesorhizobium sp. 1B3]|uniref:hypothetical protein n=1 Tax=Mesorhizobium sp. 1B3 TaxID=3243599 RepID=UPI003D9510BD
MMPGSIYSWSKLAGENDVADGDIDWREGQFPDTVNDSARQMMGRNAEWRDDITGTLTAAGTANAIMLMANSAFTSLANGRMLTFRTSANNTAAVTLNVNGLGSKAVRAMGAATDVDLAANDLKARCVYTVVYSATANGGAGAWILFAPFSKVLDGNQIDAFPAGTRLLFQQSTAPTGWTKDTSHDNKALRLVNGTVTTGGSVTFTAVFSSATPTTSVIQSGTVGGTALTVAQMPSHTHGPGNLRGATNATGTHAHNVAGSTDVQGSHSHNMAQGSPLVWMQSGSNLFVQGGGNGNTGTSGVAPAGAHNHNINGWTDSQGNHTHQAYMNAGTTDAQGENQPHTHTFSGEAHSHTTDLAVQYVDVIICEKAA